MAPKHNMRGTRLVFLMLLCSAHALAQGLAGNAGGPYFVNPYESMFGSMGNVYSPYYRQFHAPGIAGTGRMAGMSGAPGVPYAPNPYSGMFGSMGNVYSPYYRQFHGPGMGGMAGPYPFAGRVGEPGQAGQALYPTFLEPTMGSMSGTD